MRPTEIGIVMLAAGSSSRLGQAKQLLRFKEKTLLEISLEAALGSKANFTVLVLGANLDQIQREVNLTSYEVAINYDWSNGMASSMQTGLNHMLQKHEIKAIILMLSDQPLIESNILNKLISRYLNSKFGIVACRYKETLGVPVLFDLKYFKELLELNTKEGAKTIIYKHLDDVEGVDFANGAVDIDTLEDYEKLIKGF